MERQSTSDGLRRRPISRLEYERMAEVGILDERERIELLRGDLAVVPAGTPDRHPDTCLLVIEVAQTSFRIDATVKAALYAEAAIPVYWIVDVARGLVLVHTEPAAGGYQRTTEHRAGDVLTAPHLPPLAIPVAAIVAT